MKKPFRERVKDGPIICDGAMGTLLDLYEYDELPHEIQNLKNPDIVARVHQEYIDAGSEIIETNTFSANRLRLAQFHLEDKVREINIRGVEIARSVAGDRVYVSNESEDVTYSGRVNPDGTLTDLQRFADRGGECVAVDGNGNVYIANGQIFVYDAAGKQINRIDVSERPIDMVFGGQGHRTLFILTHHALYSVEGALNATNAHAN